jgi:hypothetical protein
MRGATYLITKIIKRLIISIMILPLLYACTSIEMLVEVDSHDDGATIDSYNLELHKRSIHLFDPIDLTPEVNYKQLQKRVENLIVLIDETAEMDEEYRGISRKKYAHEVLRRLNKTIPDIDLRGGVISYQSNLAVLGWLNSVSIPNWVERPPRYNPVQINEILKSSPSFPVINATNLAVALDYAGDIITRLEGRTALVIISQWESIDKSVTEAVMRLRQRTTYPTGDTVAQRVTPWKGQQGEGLCVYSIGVGNTMSRTRYDLNDTCGASYAADKIVQPRDMAHFVKRALYSQPRDDDGDGIFNYLDKCSNTPEGRLVGYDGCLLFDRGAK